MSSNKKWEGCRTCENARRRGSGNISCKVENATDGLDYSTRRELAHVNNGCEYYQGVDPIEQLERIKAAKVNDPSAGSGEPQQEVEPININFLETPIWEIDEDCINPFAELPPVQTWCNIGERPAIPKQGIVCFAAKQKQGKSLSTQAFAIPLLSGLDFGTLHPLDRPNLIMVFDMEMSKNTNTKRAKNLVQTIGKYGNLFVVFSLKGKTIEERIKTINEKIAKYNPDIVVIDQAAELVNNINDIPECNAVTRMLDKISIDRSVWCVMHLNKGKEDNNMQGHLGGYFDKRAVETYGVVKKNGVFTVTCIYARETEPENAPTFQFALDTEGKIIDGTERAKQAEKEEKAEWQKDFANLFGNDKALRHGEIKERIKTQQGLEETAAKTKINNAIDKGVIRKTGNHKTDPYELIPFDEV